jgi:hypothetical protein
VYATIATTAPTNISRNSGNPEIRFMLASELQCTQADSDSAEPLDGEHLQSRLAKPGFYEKPRR